MTREIDSFGFLMKIVTNQKTLTASIYRVHQSIPCRMIVMLLGGQHEPSSRSMSEYKAAREGPEVDLRILVDEITLVRASVMQEVNEWSM
jgi:hypothetical protein